MTITGVTHSVLLKWVMKARRAGSITAAVDIDATGFAGNVFLEYAADTLTATTDVDAGALTTDTVYALFDTTSTDIVCLLRGRNVYRRLELGRRRSGWQCV